MTETEFRTSGHRETLLALFDNPVLRLALEIVGETARPRGTVEPKPGTHLDTLVAQRFHKQSGIQGALDHLRRLTKPPETEAQVEDELEAMPFFSSLPQPVKDALRKRLNEQSSPE